MAESAKAVDVLRGRSHEQSALMRFRIWATWVTYRYRFLIGFIIIGFTSIVAEVLVYTLLRRSNVSIYPACTLGFLTSLSFALYANVRWNFRVTREKLMRTSLYFVAISCLSLGLNLWMARLIDLFALFNYSVARVVTSGTLFLVAYSLHRRFSFRGTVKNLGIAVYCSEGTDVDEVFAKIGPMCDHIHLDLVDGSFNEQAAPVDLEVVTAVAERWPRHPRLMHIMSTTPLRYIEESSQQVHGFLVHLDIDEDPYVIIARCRRLGRSIGVVWKQGIALSTMIPLLPHVDFVMVLGIAVPGQSGQEPLAEGLAMTKTFTELSAHYHFQVIHDGGVNAETINKIPAGMIVSSSAVLRAENPLIAAIQLRYDLGQSKG